MTHSLDQIHDRINALAEAGFAINCGKTPTPIKLNYFLDVEYVGVAEADECLLSPEFESLLLDLRPMKQGFQSDGSHADFMKVFNSIAELTKPYIEGIASHVAIPGLNNDPEGFGPSVPISTIEWCLVAFAQERVAVLDYGYKGPLKATDLLLCLEAGRLPVGWEPSPRGGLLKLF